MLRKHVKRHTKPHVCKIIGCKRMEGFGTANDLERHIRSCHPEQSNAPFIYLCPMDKCAQRFKEWPRADNFRAHVKRVHGDIILNDEHLEQCRHQLVFTPDHAGRSSLISDHIDLATLPKHQACFLALPPTKTTSLSPLFVEIT